MLYVQVVHNLVIWLPYLSVYTWERGGGSDKESIVWVIISDVHVKKIQMETKAGINFFCCKVWLLFDSGFYLPRRAILSNSVLHVLVINADETADVYLSFVRYKYQRILSKALCYVYSLNMVDSTHKWLGYIDSKVDITTNHGWHLLFLE